MAMRDVGRALLGGAPSDKKVGLMRWV